MNTQEIKATIAYLDILREFGSGGHTADTDTTIRGFHTRILTKFNVASAITEAAPSKLLIMFGGSNDTLDYLADSMVFPEEFYRIEIPGKIHAGFSMAWDMIRKKIIIAMLSMNPDKRKDLVIVGHSLGAALAMLCASDLKAEGYNIDKCYLVGCPRVGNKDFVEWFQKEIHYFNFVHGYDIVTAIPFIRMLGYKHVRDTIYINNGKLTYTRGYRNNLCGYLVYGISDHRLDSYIKNLQEYVKNSQHT